MKRPKRAVAYLRVSTAKQEASGLGLEAQQAAVNDWASREGATVVKAFTEIETGTRKRERPMLREALEHAELTRSVLVVAKLDRLSRNVAFLAALMDSGVDFVCCDNPNATKLTIHILAAVAEDEAVRISERTKAALKAAKARGVKLGGSRKASRNLTPTARKNGARVSAEVRTQSSLEFAQKAAAAIERLGLIGESLRTIAEGLNEADVPTRRGTAWTATQVKRVLDLSASVEISREVTKVTKARFGWK